MNEKEKRVIKILGADIPVVAEPWQKLAEAAGMSEAEFLEIAQNLQQAGTIRRFGGVLRHRAAGFSGNGLLVAVVPAEKVDETGAAFAGEAMVTHCYTRRPAEDWPYNFYAMLHATDREGCEALAAKLAESCGLGKWQLLFSVKEWKKQSLHYFTES